MKVRISTCDILNAPIYTELNNIETFIYSIFTQIFSQRDSQSSYATPYVQDTIIRSQTRVSLH